MNDILRCLMAHFTGPASFSMVTPEMLGYLYEPRWWRNESNLVIVPSN